MANPQLEDGYTKISNELLDALYRVKLSPYEMRVALYVIRKTYGYNKKSDTISLSQFEKDIGIDRRHIHRAIKKLVPKQVLGAYRGDKNVISYYIKKDYTKWSAYSGTSTQTGTKTVPIQVTKTVPKQEQKQCLYRHPQKKTKENKDNIKTSGESRHFVENSIEFQLSLLLYVSILSFYPDFKRPDFQVWASHVEKMIRIDNRNPIEIEKIIEWCKNNDFWKTNILSTKKLREKYQTLDMQMKRNIKPEGHMSSWMQEAINDPVDYSKEKENERS